MVFLDKVAEMLPGLLTGGTAMMDAGETGQLGLERVALPGGAVQVDQCIADHLLVTW